MTHFQPEAQAQREPAAMDEKSMLARK